jgi:hypothetical protein
MTTDQVGRRPATRRALAAPSWAAVRRCRQIEVAVAHLLLPARKKCSKARLALGETPPQPQCQLKIMLAPDEIMVDLSCLCGSFPGSFFYDRLAACRRQRLDHPSVAAAAKWSPPCRLLCVCVQQAKSPLAKRHAPRNSTRRYSRISSNGDETEIDGLVITVFQVQHSCVTTGEGVAN